MLSLAFLIINFFVFSAQAQILEPWSELSNYIESENFKPEASAIQAQELIKVLKVNTNTIQNYADVDLSKHIEASSKALKQLVRLAHAQQRIDVVEKVREMIQSDLYGYTLTSILISPTPEESTYQFFRTFGINLKKAESSASENQININDSGFSSNVFSKNSENYFSINIETNIKGARSNEKTGEDFALLGQGVFMLKSSLSGETIQTPLIVAQSFNEESSKDKYINIAVGRILGESLDIKQSYQVDKLVVLFESENGETIYKVKNLEPSAANKLKAIETSLVDYIANSEYAISYDKFQEAVARGNVVPLSDGEAFVVRGGQHTLGTIFWREQNLFAFYRCHNDNYAAKFIDAENCWIIKAPRKSLPSGFDSGPYTYYGVYKIFELESGMSNFDYILNNITTKLNHGQQLLYKHTDKIFANGDVRYEAIRNTRSYQNLLSGFYDQHADLFEKTMKYTYYFGLGTGVAAVVETLTGKLAHKFRGYKPDHRFKTKIVGKMNSASAKGIYMAALKYGAIVFGGTAVLYVINKAMKKFDRYMLKNELSLDLILSMSEEYKQYPEEREYFIEANKNLIDVIHAALIESLIEYNNLEQTQAIEISKESCEKIYGISCSKEMIQTLYPEGA